MAQVIKTEFYNGATLIGEKTTAPFLSFTWTGDNTPDGTTPVLSAKIYLDNGVVITSDSISIVVRSEVTTQWYELIITDYKARVESDYGSLEGEATLTTALSTMVEQDYNDMIAWYNPNGGHRTGKIYDVRDTDNTNPFDLTVTGGGGTRINKAGQVERLRENFIPHSYNLTNLNTPPDLIMNVNQVGITGEPNTATYVEETNTDSYKEISSVPSINIGTAKVSLWIKKDSNQTRFPELVIDTKVNGATVESVNFQLNTQTGAYANRNLYAGNEYVLDRGDWWEMVWISNRNDIDHVQIKIRPAMGQSLGTYSNTTTGSIIVGHVGIYTSNIVDETPIIKTGTEGFPKIDYTTGQPAFLIEPTRTNYITNSYNLTGYTIRGLGTATAVTLNQVGITGKPNTATLIEDLSTGDYGEVTIPTVSLGTGVAKVSIWIKKDTNQSRFPEFYSLFRVSGTTVESNTVQLNTETGITAVRSSLSESNYTVIDRGEWWEFIYTSIRSDVNQVSLIIRPALGTTIGTYSNTAVGSIIVGHVGFTTSSIIDETPIITNGSAVTRTKNVFKTTNFPFATPDWGGLYDHYIYGEINMSDLSTDQHLFSLYSDEQVTTYPRSGLHLKVEGGVYSLAVAIANSNLSATPTTISTNHIKFAMKIKSGDSKLFINGTQAAISTISTGGYSPTHSLNCLSIGEPNGYGCGGFPTPNMEVYDLQVLPPMTDQEAINMTTI